jgi:hypothetical protein
LPRILTLSGAGKQNPAPLFDYDIQKESVLSSYEIADSELQQAVNTLLIHQGKQYTYSISDASLLLGISEEFLRKRLVNGNIKSVRFGDRQMISVFELAKLITKGVN